MIPLIEQQKQYLQATAMIEPETIADIRTASEMELVFLVKNEIGNTRHLDRAVRDALAMFRSFRN